MSVGKFLKPWQMTAKIIEWIFMQFTFNILWVTLTQKIITHRVSKIHEWIWGDMHAIGENFLNHDKWQLKLLCFVVVVGSFQLLYGLQWDRVAQLFTNENKVSRKWSDSVHLLPFQLNKNNTTTHQVLIVKIQNQISIKLSYNIYYKTHS